MTRFPIFLLAAASLGLLAGDQPPPRQQAPPEVPADKKVEILKLQREQLRLEASFQECRSVIQDAPKRHSEIREKLGKLLEELSVSGWKLSDDLEYVPDEGQ